MSTSTVSDFLENLLFAVISLLLWGWTGGARGKQSSTPYEYSSTAPRRILYSLMATLFNETQACREV